ncbi:AlpA family phage regulatory protein [Acinetobacter sp. ANC 4282]|uniref:helix-turn-helix transcriptional regulator n=1 Tax=Acinetobacter terrae TaxID=2731247 RepID=UPI0014900E85|nr:AlpA family phage regulatory protein [Acinetobacter terrae]NNH15279.1 AlpA family phage regulatory protein [Acinetobacter terrae]
MNIAQQLPSLLQVKHLTSSKALPQRTYTTKTGENAGKVCIKREQPARNGLLPITSKTLWTWVREGKFPKPIKMNGVTVWNSADVEKWLEQQGVK